MKKTISWEDFSKVELRIGTIVDASVFPEARKPAYQLLIDVGVELGLKKSSAQITALYQAKELIGRQVLCVCNFPPKQIATFISEVLVTGVAGANDNIVLLSPDFPVENGTRLI